MKVKYKNNADKLLYLGVPAIFLIVGLVFNLLIATVLGLIFTISISSVVIQYLNSYRKGKIVLEIVNETLLIRSNGKYDIPLKDINVLEISTNKKGRRKQLDITYVDRDQIKKVSLVDLYELSLEDIQKEIRKHKKKSV